MVDPGEEVSVTLKREFSEEAMGSLDASKDEVEKIRSEVNNAFSNGREVGFGFMSSIPLPNDLNTSPIVKWQLNIS